MVYNKPSLLLYYDVVSPYAWVAFESLLRYEKVLDVKLELLPVSIGFMLKQLSTKPLANQSSQKALNLQKDLKLVGRYWNIPFNSPKDFNKSLVAPATLNPQRFITALSLHCDDFLPAVSREFWMRAWSRDEPIYDWESIREICQKLDIPRVEELIRACATDEVKALLKARTDAALAQNACGLPWLVLRRQGQEDVHIWGSDRLHVICDLLGKPFLGPLRDKSAQETAMEERERLLQAAIAHAKP